MYQYLDLMRRIVTTGTDKEDRTGTGTRSIFGAQLRFNLQDGFPLLTTKKLFITGILAELLWFLEGKTNNAWLNEQGVHIWDEWAAADGNLGPIYGAQWRDWLTPSGGYIDQIRNAVDTINTDPTSRRIVVSAWNPADLPRAGKTPQENAALGYMCLAPCHCMFQLYVANETLSCHMYQRSADYFLGVPFNIASYAFLTHMFAQQCDLSVGDLIISFGDVHLYKNHLTEDIVFKQLSRTPKHLPYLKLNRKPPSMFSYRINDFSVLDYTASPPIKAPISV